MFSTSDLIRGSQDPVGPGGDLSWPQTMVYGTVAVARGSPFGAADRFHHRKPARRDPAWLPPFLRVLKMPGIIPA
jgi:hypothetical protein